MTRPCTGSAELRGRGPDYDIRVGCASLWETLEDPPRWLTSNGVDENLGVMSEPDVFKHASPALYDRYMGPLLFAPYADYVASLIASLEPKLILETAAGTGIATRAVSKAVPKATIIATDVNPAVVEFAAQQDHSESVSFRCADAQELPFDDGSFDVVLCLFGVMFFPDKRRGNAEAYRVLRPGGRYVLATFNQLELNPVPEAAGVAVATLFSEDPRYMARGPFSYTDPEAIEDDLRAGGFQTIDLMTVELSTVVSAQDAARGIVLGSPFRAEIERLDPSALERAVEAVEQALQPWHGKTAPISAHIASTIR